MQIQPLYWLGLFDIAHVGTSIPLLIEIVVLKTPIQKRVGTLRIPSPMSNIHVFHSEIFGGNGLAPHLPDLETVAPGHLFQIKLHSERFIWTKKNRQ